MIRRFGQSFGSAVPLQGHKARMGTCFTGTDITIICGCYVWCYHYVYIYGIWSWQFESVASKLTTTAYYTHFGWSYHIQIFSCILWLDILWSLLLYFTGTLWIELPHLLEDEDFHSAIIYIWHQKCMDSQMQVEMSNHTNKPVSDLVSSGFRWTWQLRRIGESKANGQERSQHQDV